MGSWLLEGHLEAGPAGQVQAGRPDTKDGKVNFGIGIPSGLSFLVQSID